MPRGCFVVGVAGGSGSGKTSVVRAVARRLDSDLVTVVRHDWYYRDLSHLTPNDRALANFDHPDSLETELLERHLRALRAGQPVDAPTYDFATHTRGADVLRLHPTRIVLLDGILVLSDARLRALIDYSVFVEVDATERLARRLRRDTRDRGRSPESVRAQFLETVQPMHERYVEPSRGHADLTITGGAHNEEGVGRLLSRLREVLKQA